MRNQELRQILKRQSLVSEWPRGLVDRLKQFKGLSDSEIIESHKYDSLDLALEVIKRKRATPMPAV